MVFNSTTSSTTTRVAGGSRCRSRTNTCLLGVFMVAPFVGIYGSRAYAIIVPAATS
jgi:hypothetical protein